MNIVSSDSLEILESVIEEYASVGQDLKGPKMKVVCSQQRQREVRDKLSRMTKLTMTAEQIDASIHTTPTKLLGGCVFPLGEVPEACPTLTELMAKLSKRYKKITQLDVSLQMKWLILKNITFYSVFYIEHWGQHAQRIAGLRRWQGSRQFVLREHLRDLRNIFFCARRRCRVVIL